MGVLDDAIREHIKLQRLHGASEEDLRRQEREALGPARREAPKQDEEALGALAGGAADDFDRQRTQVLPPPDPEDFHETPPPAEPELARPADEPAAEPLATDDGSFIENDPFAEDEPFTGEVTEVELVEGEDDEDDVLEETPEFLQETPEHDRLWFEQKPPRDFDFDDK